jgi:hypothetical protein
VTVGSVEPMKQLFARWSDQVHFLDVVIRQAHPGPDVPPYRTFEEKWQDAVRYRNEEGIPFPVLVDDLEGTVHQTYGGLADPTYLIDADGRVACYTMWTYVPTLHQALHELERQGWSGVVDDGINPLPHMLPALTTGWRGLRRGLPNSLIDMETAAPGSGVGVMAGYAFRPLLAPFTQRFTPLPTAVKVGLVAAGVGLACLALRRGKRA